MMRRLAIVGLSMAGIAVLGCDRALETFSRPPHAGQPGALQEPPVEFVASFAAGYQQARTGRRPMLVFFTAEWCTYCDQMVGDAFVDPEVRQLARRFTCVKVDADHEIAVCRQFRVEAFPTVQFISPGGVPLNRLVGRKPGSDLAAAMRAALHAVAQRQQAQETMLR